MKKQMIVYDFSNIGDVLDAPEVRMMEVETREEAASGEENAPDDEMERRCDQLRAALEEADQRAERAETERDDLARIFELQRKRARPWIERWRQETGKYDSVPDYGATLQWICDKADRAEAALARAEEIAKEASLIIDDDRHDDNGCRFVDIGAGDEDSSQEGVTCFACLAQDELAKIRVEALMAPAGRESSREVEGGSDGLQQS